MNGILAAPLRAIALALGLAAAAAAGCASQNPSIPEGKEVDIARVTFADDQASLGAELMPAYTIAPGDELDVLFQMRTWGQKDEFKIAADHLVEVKFLHASELDQSQRVRPDGTISLPYVGDIYVIGKQVEQLQQELQEKYAKILRNPRVLVVVPDFRSAIKELKADLHTAPRGLSRLVTVRPDGVVTFPMVGEMKVAGRTIAEVNKDLNGLYEKYLPGLHCDLFLEKTLGAVVYVQGEVKRPGSFPITKPISVHEALALAGSTTTAANLENVIVVRRRTDRLVARRVDLAKSLDLADGRAFFMLRPDDIVLVPRSRIADIAEVARNIADIIMFRGWGISLGWDVDAPFQAR